MSTLFRTLVIGCGYVGLPLALRLQQGKHEVTCWVHSKASAASLAAHSFHRVITGSVADNDIWASLGETYHLVVHCASSGRGGETAYEQVFLKGVLMMNAYQPEARRVFVSSTSVYHQTHGEVVTEETPVSPSPVTGRILRVAERSALKAEGIVVRSAGIYGPGRAMLWEKFRRGEAVIEGDGLRWINQIHQRDLVSALTHVIQAGTRGEIYNASDDTPVTQLDYYAWCGQVLRRPLPPHGPAPTTRKRGLTSKIVSNAKLHAAGWTPLYPSFREGLMADYPDEIKIDASS